MKNTIFYLLFVSIFLQGCYSYKTIDLNQTKLQEGKIYKVKQEDKFVKATLKTLNDSTTTFLVGKSEKQIPITSIKEIKVKKFSVLKTVSLFPITIAVIVIGFTATYNGPQLGPIQFPN